ncbi:hypothetical protein [Acetobacterium tundrae]|uniref:Uncharacterized protein n=1 Tax=Acetobacterium tundrae TaxID=132932 RepID=A0ABR6WQH7_9FIRM|nr:hypothetical protein [Acetobacterium tundrae]MBC3798598.1 hypothetical protein [Acetobacterium tundrae]
MKILKRTEKGAVNAEVNQYLGKSRGGEYFGRDLPSGPDIRGSSVKSRLLNDLLNLECYNKSIK